MIEFLRTQQLVSYPDALEFMDDRFKAILSGEKPELVWFLQHPPLYTMGTSSDERDLLSASEIPVFQSGRGGQITYHGPGQRVVYILLNLKKRTPDIRKYIRDLEQWLILSLAHFGVDAQRRDDRVGLWVENGRSEDKIAAIGVRVQKWITMHGIALNVDPNLEHFKNIVPCGIRSFGVTSLKKLGKDVSFDQLDDVLQETFINVFGHDDESS